MELVQTYKNIFANKKLNIIWNFESVREMFGELDQIIKILLSASA